MGEVRKIGEEYYIEFLARGLKYQQKAGRDLALAQKLLKDIEGKIAQGEMSILVRDVDWDIFTRDVLMSVRKEHTAKTYRRYVQALKHFSQFLYTRYPRFTKVSQITPSLLEDYKASLLKSPSRSLPNKEKMTQRGLGGVRLKPMVINFTFVLLNDIFKYAIRWTYLNDNPTLHIRLFSNPQASKLSILTEQQLNSLQEKKDEPIAPILSFLSYTGLRFMELTNLRWEDVDWGKNYFVVKKIRARISRKIPIHPKVQVIFKRLHREDLTLKDHIFCDQNRRPLEIAVLKRDISYILKDMKISCRSIESLLNDTFAVNALQSGVSLIGLYQLLGMTDVAGALRYFDSYWGICKRMIIGKLDVQRGSQYN